MQVQPESFLDGKVRVFSGDSAAVIKTLADDSIDACVCDPPYALVSITEAVLARQLAATYPLSPSRRYGRLRARCEGFHGQRLG